MYVVQVRCDGSEIATLLNEFNQSLEGIRKICRRWLTGSKKIPIRKFYVLVVQQRKKSERKAVRHHAQRTRRVVPKQCFDFWKPLLSTFFVKIFYYKLNPLRTRTRSGNWTFWSPLFSIIIWLVYLSSGGPTKDLVRKTYLGVLSTTLVLKFNLSTEFFCKWKEHFLYSMYTKN